ncbi:MAG: hypothetical protein KF797_00465, partial [Flavobacteriales bacterium]|nr:hypothetical protein [Flavobacteriales bacterium]
MRSFASYACLFLTAPVLNAQTPFCPEETFVPWEGMPIHCNDLVEYEGSIYGLDAYFTRTLWRYDPATGQTTALSGPPVALWGISLAQAGGRLYTFGGYPGPGIGNGLSAQAHVYDIATDSWSSLPNLPFGLVTTSSAVVGDDIFITGSTHGVTVRYFFRYSIASNSYTVLTPPDSEASCRLIAFNGMVYSVGGDRYAPPYVTMDHFRVYDPSSATWQDLPNMPFERSEVAACVWGGYLHVFGGGMKSGVGEASLSHYYEHFAYDFAAGQWQ